MWSPLPASLANRSTQRPLATYARRYLKPCSLPREGAGSLQITISTKALWLSTRRSRSSSFASMLLTLATLLGVVYKSNTGRDFRPGGQKKPFLVSAAGLAELIDLRCEWAE